MTPIGAVFSIVAALLLLVLPRRHAAIPLIAAACYMTLGQGIMLAGLNLYVLRLLIGVGLLRLALKGETNPNGLGKVDAAMTGWGLIVLLAGIYHHNLQYYSGIIYNGIGFYVLFRVFIQDLDDARRAFLSLGILLIPVALFMGVEKMTGRNLFSVLGGVPELAAVRENTIRAQGPFLHPILAGTAGASTIPVLIAMWNANKRLVLPAVIACGMMVVFCASSGPIITVLAGAFGIIMWKYRVHLRSVILIGLLTLVGLELVMKAHVWYLLGRFDLAGGSTGWYRAELITQAFSHLNEWWVGGTDHTRHWMPWGASYDEDNVDITNHYILMGVWGGLPLMFAFINTMRLSFSSNRDLFHAIQETKVSDRFFVWTLGATVFAHAVTFISVAYFDQIVVLWFLMVATIASLERRFSERDAHVLHGAREGGPNLTGIGLREDLPGTAPVAQSLRS